MIPFDLVYLRVFCSFPKTYDVNQLISAVAHYQIYGDGIQLYETVESKKGGTIDIVHSRRTKRFVLNKTRRFISNLARHLCPDENMALYVSMKQMNRLVAACASPSEGRKEISCYSIIYIYIIYTLLDPDSLEAKECKGLIEQLYNAIGAYLQANPGNQLASFLFGCYAPIVTAIGAKNSELTGDKLPSVPRKTIP